jgi:uncharacterized protein (TIGR00255 family)
MLKSMTGFGSAQGESLTNRINIEIKSLNSKFLDASLRLPKDFMSKEIEVRNMLTTRLERGKISLIIECISKENNSSKGLINRELLKKYYSELHTIALELNAPITSLLETSLTLPGLLENTQSAELIEKEWVLINSLINQALDNCEKFRLDEGAILSKKFVEYIQKIDSLLKQVAEQDPRRLVSIREKIKMAFSEYAKEEMVDKNRFEQELIYYIEKLDIAEEKVRLQSHLNYFLESLGAKETSGKKLGFIAQEIGREINTIGSKANDAIIQKLVVEMKEELEKIKEQVLNIL